MRKKYRKIIVNELPFLFWHNESYDEDGELTIHKLILSPSGNRGNKIIVEFSRNENEEPIIENPWDLSTHKFLTLSGWRLFEQMGYSNFTPVISWSWW